VREIRADVDDASRAARLHAYVGELREQGRRLEVHVQHPINSLETHGLNGRFFADARVVHQNIDRSQRPLRVDEQAPRRRHVADVASPGE
jgi:hypothetical protein